MGWIDKPLLNTHHCLYATMLNVNHKPNDIFFARVTAKMKQQRFSSVVSESVSSDTSDTLTRTEINILQQLTGLTAKYDLMCTNTQQQ